MNLDSTLKDKRFLHIRQLVFDGLIGCDLPRQLYFPVINHESLNMARPVPDAEIQAVLAQCLVDGLIGFEPSISASDRWPEGMLYLTVPGTLAWEQLAEPDWERQWDEATGEEDTVLTGRRRSHLEFLIATGPWPRIGDVDWQRLEPFEPRPGFTFAEGWQASFRTSGFCDPAARDAESRFYDCQRWFLHPREHPEWPFPGIRQPSDS